MNEIQLQAIKILSKLMFHIKEPSMTENLRELSFWNRGVCTPKTTPRICFVAKAHRLQNASCLPVSTAKALISRLVRRDVQIFGRHSFLIMLSERVMDTGSEDLICERYNACRRIFVLLTTGRSADRSTLNFDLKLLCFFKFPDELTSEIGMKFSKWLSDVDSLIVKIDDVIEHNRCVTLLHDFFLSDCEENIHCTEDESKHIFKILTDARNKVTTRRGIVRLYDIYQHITFMDMTDFRKEVATLNDRFDNIIGTLSNLQHKQANIVRIKCIDNTVIHNIGMFQLDERIPHSLLFLKLKLSEVYIETSLSAEAEAEDERRNFSVTDVFFCRVARHMRIGQRPFRPPLNFQCIQRDRTIPIFNRLGTFPLWQLENELDNQQEEEIEMGGEDDMYLYDARDDPPDDIDDDDLINTLFGYEAAVTQIVFADFYMENYIEMLREATDVRRRRQNEE